MGTGALELQKAMVRELIRGEEYAKQLNNTLHSLNSSSEEQSLMLKEIVSSFGNVLSLIKSSNPNLAEIPTVAVVHSPWSSMDGGPANEDGSGKASTELQHPDISKKRKALPKWTEQVFINPATGLQGSVLDDGYTWRKYGQKGILGAKYRRDLLRCPLLTATLVAKRVDFDEVGYYRCTHRHLQGCQATKQVQRSDDNPSIFDIRYSGKHSCNQASHFTPAMSLPAENQKKMQQPRDHQPELFMSYKSMLKVETQVRDEPDPATESFTFSLTPEDQQVHYQQLSDQLADSAGSPSFVSPTTPENYPKDISAVMSATDSLIIGTEFPLSPFDLDHCDLTFHLPGFI